MTAVGVLGAVLAASTQARLDRLLSAAPGLRAFADAQFMSSLLAGDLARALERVPPSAAGALAQAAPVAFASGFADALTVSGGARSPPPSWPTSCLRNRCATARDARSSPRRALDATRRNH